MLPILQPRSFEEANQRDRDMGMRHWSTGNMSLAWLNVELVAPLVLGSGCLITRCYSPILGHTALMHFFPISPRRLLAMTHARPCRLTEPRITIHPNFAPPRCTGFSRADLLGASCLACRTGSEGIYRLMMAFCASDPARRLRFSTC